jgi:CsoR family transcriptional regulator, copper-sensing transcriptional repressor
MSAHTQTKRVADRLARIQGHVGAIKRMVEEGRPCPDVLVQMAAVRSALDKTAKLLLGDHIEHCLTDSLRRKSAKSHLGDLRTALERYLG